MSNQYGNSPKAKGPSKSLEEHPGSNSKGTSDEPFSQMRKVDLKEGHLKTIENMSSQAGSQSSMNISDKHPYKRQAHAIKPAGEIKSFVGNRVDSDPGQKPSIKRPKSPKGEY